MNIRKTIAAGALSVTMVVGSAGVALAADGSNPAGNRRAPATRSCDGALQRLEQAKAKAQQARERIAQGEAKVAELLAAGKTEEAARLQARIDRAKERLAHVVEHLGKIEARIAAHCPRP